MIEFRSAPARFAELRRARLEDSLAGRRILLTDACSEIGRATAELLTRRGAELLLIAKRGDRLAAACTELTRDGGRAHWYRCDISALGDVDMLVDWVLREYGSVDVLINNAGRPLHRPVLQSLDRFRDYQRMMAANYFGPLRLTLGLLPAMLASGSGHVVNVGPWSPETGAAPNFASYASSQAAWTTFGLCADAELAPRGIHVTAVHYPAARTGSESDGEMTEPAETARWIETAIRTRPSRDCSSAQSMLSRTLRGLAGVAPRSTSRLIHAFGI
ncbi:SDR family NAD(P)-dependent oxidoreductase [Nocardia transvalensis]|uniref:SDR family NAD(P)-dependent oxidoreductase n=1 Tax=Nocardia transvalensis TaxID=37333 RepID=UPI0018947F51|nr:SDR family NAD(P)-dependent oxidoreductase [Nocardia transvalensis]MBF6330220.1 SDR family NAD(P)-dependent oxidoreductase [Nocardia transvalensis]